MATYYGSALAAVNTTLSDNFTPHVSVVHGRQRIARSTVTVLALTTDLVRMISLRSTDRLFELYLAGNGGATAGATDVGAYYAGDAHDGAVIDADEFATAVTSPSTAAGADVFAEAATSREVLRGAPLWEAVGLSADPGGYIDITMTPSTSFTAAAPIMVMTAHYVAGD